MKWLNNSLWGTSVALSWMWGLGLFFSVQISHLFGWFGLLMFAIPNALGLVIFGIITQHIANRSNGSESLAQFFTHWARPFRFIFFLYQLLAITLTIFAAIRYIWQPMQLEPVALYLPLTTLIILAAGCLFGEEFNIKRIKYSHGVLFGILLLSLLILGYGISADGFAPIYPSEVVQMAREWNFWGLAIPLAIGLLVGPWLDLQQWQRAIQIHRENASVSLSYLIGGIVFFLLLLFHGGLTLWGMGRGIETFVQVGQFDHMGYAQGALTAFFFEKFGEWPWLFAAYIVFTGICILTTLDSGYVALRWFLTSNVKTSKNAIFSLIPEWLVVSPVPWFLFCGFVALVGAVVKLELEYFMIFYGTFFVGYAILAITRCFSPRQGNALPQIKMFCVGSLAVVIFAYGYFLKLPVFQITGSLLPVAYIIWLLFKPGATMEFVTDAEKLESPVTEAPEISEWETPKEHKQPLAFASSHQPTGVFEDKWFVHRFVATYADTNSVGNVYFGMYAMWVGKTRELFFHHCLPKFDLKTTPYYILTRSFEHKFMRETREFEEVKLKIRVAKFNRKFVTLEHEIYDSKNQMLGRGQQSLIFVASADYSLIDIPQEVYNGFIAYT